MEQMNLAENIIRLRRQRGITQEQLADFLGVTKASVSKWETRQSMPDILLLPRIAAFFDVTIDALIGYEPQLSKEQIQKIYRNLALKFASCPYSEAMEESRRQVKRYYSCYPFLLQICVLWLNHYMLPEEPQSRQEILKEIESLCGHIIKNCGVLKICNDAITLKAMASLQLGRAAEVVETLEEAMDPRRISGQNEVLLIQAYQMLGDYEKAKSYAQVSMYVHLLSLVGCAVQRLEVEIEDLEKCRETMRRMEDFLQIFDLEKLHPNITAQFYYQSALVFGYHKEEARALENLQKYAKTVLFLMREDHMKLHGNRYFDCLQEFIESLELGDLPPRNPGIVADSLPKTLDHPLLTFLRETSEFAEIRTKLSGVCVR